MNKNCKDCKIEKEISEYHSNKKGILCPYCKSCVSIRNKIRYSRESEKLIAQTKARYRKDPLAYKARSKKWVENNPERAKDRHLKQKYGISLEEYNTLLKAQEHKCAICLVSQLELKQDLSVDHCHSTGKIRGLLCGSCNRGIGVFKDDCAVIANIIIYLTNNYEKANGKT